MLLFGFDLIKEKFNTLNNNAKIVKIKDGVIPYNEIVNQKNVTFIVIANDEKLLKLSLDVIEKVHEQNKNMNINVVVSSSYEKLHKLSNGVF